MTPEVEIYKYLYKRDKPVFIKILGSLVAAFAIIRIANTPVFSVIMGLGSIGLFSYQTGIEINFKNKMHRLISSFGPVNLGDWQPLPRLKYVSIFRVNLVSTVTGRSGASITQKEGVIQVNLITEQNKKLRLLETEDLDEALQFAKELSPKLNLKIWDAMEKKGKWLLDSL